MAFHLPCAGFSWASQHPPRRGGRRLPAINIQRESAPPRSTPSHLEALTDENSRGNRSIRGHCGRRTRPGRQRQRGAGAPPPPPTTGAPASSGIRSGDSTGNSASATTTGIATVTATGTTATGTAIAATGMTMIAAATGAAMTATGGPSPLTENHSTRRTRIGGWSGLPYANKVRCPPIATSTKLIN